MYRVLSNSFKISRATTKLLSNIKGGKINKEKREINMKILVIFLASTFFKIQFFFPSLYMRSKNSNRKEITFEVYKVSKRIIIKIEREETFFFSILLN